MPWKLLSATSTTRKTWSCNFFADNGGKETAKGGARGQSISAMLDVSVVQMILFVYRAALKGSSQVA